MKQLTCEMCGSTDLVKQDGMFVCQSCGTKYSVEEAKKMMVEGTVSIDGVVKTENADFEIRAGELIAYHGSETNVVIPDGVKIIGENCFKDMQGIESVTIPESVYCIKMQAFFGCRSLQSIYIPDSVTHIESLAFGDTDNLTNVRLSSSIKPEDIERLGAHCYFINEDGDDDDRISWGWITSPWFQKEHEKYQAETRRQKEIESVRNLETDNTNQNKSGCYIATAVYGSYDCPQVWTLRRYRDNQLAKTWHGRVFIHTYYAVSPTLVKMFGKTEWFKKLWRGKLDHMVESLNARGVENTPYQDKPW